MTARFAGLGLLWFTSNAWAQQPSLPPVPAPAPAQTAEGTITFFKEANSTVPAKKTSTLIPSVPDTVSPGTLPPTGTTAQSVSQVPPLPALAPTGPTAAPAAVRTVPTNNVSATSVPTASGRAVTVSQPVTQQYARQTTSPRSARPGYTAGSKEDDGETEDQSPLPGPNALFKLESEASWMERMRQDSRSKGTLERLVFPDEPPVSNEKYVGRDWKPHGLEVEPSYVCYGRLYFEDKNAERYGWDLGAIHPLLSTTKFWYDCAMLPYNMFSDPCHRMESSAGYCLPGDPVPLMLYPPKLSLTGFIAEAGVAVGLVFIFP
jgi:hypothetical protein